MITLFTTQDKAKELTDRGLSENSINSLGELLGKKTRNRLALICLNSIDDKQDDYVNSEPRRAGRPRSSEAILAGMLGVSVRTVERWMNAEDVQASDLNAERLAEFAYSVFPEVVTGLLRSEATEHVSFVESWLRMMSQKG